MRHAPAYLLTAAILGAVLSPTQASTPTSGKLSLSGAWAMYPTALAWADAFMKKNPQVKINVSAGGAGKGAADAIAGLVDIGMVSREPDTAELAKGITAIYVLHDAVFPIVNESNPALAHLTASGVTKARWAEIYAGGTLTTWDQIAGVKLDKPIHLYTRSDACGAASSWAKFMNKKQEDLRGVGINSDPGLVEAVKRDPLGLGYANFSFVFGRDGAVVAGVKLVPIDANANGVADSAERFANRAQAVSAIEAGTYPAARRNYFFVRGKPQGLVREFILFALSKDGYDIVNQTGASLPLPPADLEHVLASLH